MLIWLIVLFAAAIALLLVLTARPKLHPFAALVTCAVAYGLAADMSFAWVLGSIGTGMAANFGSVGLMLLAGTLVALFLERSGAGSRLARVILGDGRPRPVGALMALAGWVAGIGASVEAAFLVLAPLARALAAAAGRSAAAAQLRLGLALLASHGLVVPAPAPIIAATILDADIARVLGFGLIASAAGTLGGWAFVALAGRAAWLPRAGGDRPSPAPPDPASAGAVPDSIAPPPWMALLPIAVPLLLLMVGSVGQLPSEPFGGGGTRELLTALGGPVMMLVASLLMALTLPAWRFRGGGWGMTGETGWLASAFVAVAPVLLITAAAAGFARVLQNSGVAELAAEALADAVTGGAAGGLGLLLAFAIAAVIRIAQGSVLVATISAAGFCEPLLGPLGLGDADGRVLCVLAIGAGAIVASHANDSLFWVVSRAIGLSVADGYRLQTPGSTCAGLAALLALLGLRAVGG